MSDLADYSRRYRIIFKSILLQKENSEPMICLSDLSANDKKLAWQKIKEDQPDLAVYLKSEFTQSIVKQFSAKIWITKL